MSFEAYNGPNYLSWYQHSEVNNIPILLLSWYIQASPVFDCKQGLGFKPFSEAALKFLWGNSNWQVSQVSALTLGCSSRASTSLLVKSPAQAAASQALEEVEWGQERRKGKGEEWRKGRVPVTERSRVSATGYILCLNYPFVLTTALWNKCYYYLPFMGWRRTRGASERLRDTFGLQVAGSCHTCRFVSSHALKLLG